MSDKKRPVLNRKIAKETRGSSVSERVNVASPLKDQNFMALKKAIIEHPHSSDAWIKFIAYHVEKGRVDEARAQTQKALAVISFSNAADKINIWKGYINLEFHFGDAESLLAVYRQACAAAGIEVMAPHILSLHTASQRFGEAEFYAKDLIKRAKDRMAAWKVSLGFYIAWKAAEEGQVGQPDAAPRSPAWQKMRDILRRALQSLPPQKHREIIAFYAKSEYEHGDFEAARTNFENLVANFPRRNDIWSVYIDQEMKHTRDREHIRGIFERVTSLKKNLKQMQSFFGRFLEFEKKYGDEASQEAVLAKAKHFVDTYAAQREAQSAD